MSVAAIVAPAAPVSAPDAIRVMIVDDAVVVRGLVSRWIDAEPDLKVVASLRTGREAVDQLLRHNPDVVLLDIEMPELDGIEALPLLLEKKRDLIVIMASTLTRRNAEVSLRALSLGAADYIPKPATNREVTTSASFRRDLIEKVRQLGARRKRAFVGKPAAIPIAPVRPRVVPIPSGAVPAPAIGHGTDIKLRSFSLMPPRVLLIGSSTGGPQALTGLVGEIAAVLERAPVLITQHMPPTFTTIMAEHLARAGHCAAHEAEDGETIVPGTIYLAPGGRHMSVTRRDGQPAIALSDGPLVNFCRPAVDPLFSSAAQVWTSGVMAVILTGMGSDGTHGAEDVAAAGGSVIAQDEASSVVWGMPGAAANAGVCSAVLPLDQIAPKLVRLFRGERP
ncbi:MAG: two-component system, chemotaxis family, protein-glutamate methylesterase/glutaminase [Hyphomicrobiales bacterium]|jgi:two-component system chemotaxis response regulator CheB|nr:two-component system, chemotaxis family, protein-glutamate methylesterase/glutaminase [Hyphomicrobiales bacterium]